MVVVVVIVMAVVAPDWLWFEHMSNIETRAFKKRGKERGAGLGGQKQRRLTRQSKKMPVSLWDVLCASISPKAETTATSEESWEKSREVKSK